MALDAPGSGPPCQARGRLRQAYQVRHDGVGLFDQRFNNSPRAIETSILVVRAFIRLREILITHKGLAFKLNELERRMGVHDEQIVAVFEAVRRLMMPPDKSRRRIGFEVKEPSARYDKGGKKK